MNTPHASSPRYFVGSMNGGDVAARLNRDARDAAAYRALALPGKQAPVSADKSTPSGSRSIRADILRMLNLPEDASEEQLYRKVLGEGSDLRATGTAGPSDAQRINSAGYGASRVGVIGAALSRESRRLVACGAATDILSAQRLAVARDPSLLRR